MKFPKDNRYIKMSKPQLRKALDRWFQRYIRLRDCNHIINGERYGVCSTCGRIVPMFGNDCGHFASRRYDRTRWNEDNSHFQCHWCNGRMKGRQADMWRYIDRKYGQGTADKLIKLSKINQRFEKYELMPMIEFYKRKVKEYEQS